MQFNLAGLSFRPASAKKVFGELEPGDEVDLIREPDNRYDHNAIQIYFRGEHIGYVAAVTAITLAPILDERGGSDVARCDDVLPPRSASFTFDAENV